MCVSSKQKPDRIQQSEKLSVILFTTSAEDSRLSGGMIGCVTITYHVPCAMLNDAAIFTYEKE